MTHVLGQPDQFAIEFEIDQMNGGGQWLFGKFRYRAHGNSVGDFDMRTSLRDVLFGLYGIAKYRGRRDSDRFATAAAPEVYDLLDRCFFRGLDEPTRKLSVEEEWARHRVLPSVDVFDDWMAYLVETPTAGRFICKHKDGPLVEHSIPRGGFDEALMQAINALDVELANAGNG